MNCFTATGRLGQTPEIKTLDSGKKVCKFSIGVDTGDKNNPTFWASCVLWDKKAEIAEKYLDKGSLIAIQGNLYTESYTAKDGNKVSKTVVKVNEFNFLEKKATPTTDDFMGGVEDDPPTF